MPTFFDKNKLTQEQQASWNTVVAKYEQVMQHNRKLAGNLSSLNWEPEAGHPKSALFARLLSGKEPLPFPPATSYSYPWYDLFEAPIGQAFQVTDVRPISHSGFYINQCIWDFVSSNPSGYGLQSRYLTTDIQQIEQLYKDAPEFILRFGKWPNTFRMFVGQGKSSARRDHAEKVVLRQLSPEPRNAFDLLTLQFNAKIGKTLAKAKSPAAKIAQLEQDIRDNPDHPVLQYFLEQARAKLDADNEKFFKNPVATEWVELFYDCWLISPN